MNRQIGQIQDMVKELEKEFQSNNPSSTEAIIILKNEKITDVNDDAHGILGFTANDLVGVNPMVIFPESQPDGISTQDKISRIIKNLKDTDSIEINFQIQHKNGFLFMAKVVFRKSGSKDEIFLSITKSIKDSENETNYHLQGEKVLTGISEV